MASFEDCFDGPVTMDLGGDVGTLTVPKATIRDYQGWCSEITDLFKTKAKASLPATLPPVERYNILRQIETTEATPDDVIPYLFTPKGIERLLKLVLQKAGKNEQEASDIIDKLTVDEAKELAMRTSGLFNKRRLMELFAPKPEGGNGKAGGADPLPGAPAEMVPATLPQPSPSRLTFG